MTQITSKTLPDNLRLVTYRALVTKDECEDLVASLVRAWEDDPTQWATRGGPVTVEDVTPDVLSTFTTDYNRVGKFFFGDGFTHATD